MSSTDKIKQESQRLAQDVIIALFELDTGGGGIVRFAPEPVDGQPVRFGGEEYFPLPIQATGFEWNGKGALPRPRLTVSALDMAVIALVLSTGDLVGMPIVRRRTYRKHLDDGIDPDPEAQFPADHYVIERKAAHTKTALQFELSSQLDQEGRAIPARQILRDSCTHRYRYRADGDFSYEGVTCPYTGAACFDAAGKPTTADKDRCGKRLSDCKARFGQYAALPFYGFPGVGRFRS
jgi:lambda family phage minor tail protein L